MKVSWVKLDGERAKSFPGREVGAPLKVESVGRNDARFCRSFPGREVGAPLKGADLDCAYSLEWRFPGREVGAPLKGNYMTRSCLRNFEFPRPRGRGSIEGSVDGCYHRSACKVSPAARSGLH